MSKFESIVPLLSLVDQDGVPLRDLIEAHLAWLKETRIDGVLVMGTTGEFPCFSVEQRKHYLDVVLATQPGVDVMVNIGAASLADTLELQRHAVSHPQVSRLLWMPPFYFPDLEFGSLAPMVSRVLEYQPNNIPLLMYHLPKMSQVNITPELLNTFSRLAGLKDSSGDFERIAHVRQACPQKQLYVGTDFKIQQTKALGCDGIISGLANLFPHYTRQVVDGHVERQETIRRLREALTRHHKIPAMKAYLHHLGLSSQKSSSMLPFSDLSPLEHETLMAELDGIQSEVLTHAG